MDIRSQSVGSPVKFDDLNQLLYEEESPTLDFKRDQYPFSKATDEEKSELLKDILGFVNCWRRAEAVIVIGVEDIRGGRSIVHGVSDHLHDHSLQQFVNNITNRPVLFRYEACEIDGKQVGIIRIEQQRRPVFLKRDYGKLKKGEVYVRRGSSTDPTKPADPDEIAMMGAGYVASTQEASLTVEFADLDQEISLGNLINWSAEFCEMPDLEDIPYLEDRPHRVTLPGGHTFDYPNPSSYDFETVLNRDYYHELSEYEFVRRLFRKVRLAISNTGDVAATDVCLEFTIPTNSGIVVVESPEIPDRPKRRTQRFGVNPQIFKNIRSVIRHPGDVSIAKNEHRMKLEIACGNLQPGRSVWTKAFWLAIGSTGVHAISGLLFAANLSEPNDFSLSFEATIARTTMTLEELISMGKV